MSGFEYLLFHHLTNLHLSLTSNCPGNQLCYVETSHGLCTASVPASRWPRPETNNGPVSKAALCPVQPPPGFLISELRQRGLICNAFCNIMVQYIANGTLHTKYLQISGFSNEAVKYKQIGIIVSDPTKALAQF